jgi:hypothetical protein
MVPLLPSRVVSKSYRTIADLIPDPNNTCDIVQIRNGATPAELEAAEVGTVGRDGKYSEAFLIKVYRVRTPGNRPLDEAPRLKVNYFEADK